MGKGGGEEEKVRERECVRVCARACACVYVCVRACGVCVSTPEQDEGVKYKSRRGRIEYGPLQT